MSKLKEKSDFNYDAAQELLTHNLYAPSIHCSYYSCFQLLKFKIKDFFGIDYDEQEKTMIKTKKSTHKYVIEYIRDNIKSRIDIKEERTFIRNIKDLQNFRIDSDYKNIEINSEKGNKAYKIAEELRNFIIKTL